MLVKLMKYEFRASARLFLPAYCIFAALLVIERISILGVTLLENTPLETARQISEMSMFLLTLLVVLALFALFACPMVFAALRFYRNTVTDEGYLTFTLPVKAGQVILSKLFVSVIWQIATAIFAALFGFLFFLTIDPPETLSVLRQLLEELFSLFRDTPQFPIYLMEGILTVPVQAACGVLQAYCAISIGQLSNRHKLLSAIGIYIGMGIAASILSQMITLPALFTFASSQSSVISAFFDSFLLSMTLALLVQAGLAVMYFFLCRYFLEKKLNLA